jgi:hypothetical protein
MPSCENPLRFVQISDTHINPDTSYNSPYARFTPLVGAKVNRIVSALVGMPAGAFFLRQTY